MNKGTRDFNGFVLEDEEKAILDGMHELYTPSEPKKEGEVEA